MKTIYSTLIFCLITSISYSQTPLKLRGNASGLLALGMRSTVSMFNGHDWNTIGIGAGGHFRIQYLNQVNSEWFADFAVSDIGGYAHREDYHIGTSVMFYPIPGNDDYSKPVKPFIEMGYCFDWTRIKESKNPSNEVFNFSSALPIGLGTHFNLTPQFDVTLKAQYMMHLGSDLDVEKDETTGEVHIEKHLNPSLEGHLFISLSVNYKIIDMWGKKTKS